MVRWVPKVAPEVLLREGVFGRFGALNGPECVGVKALVEAAIVIVVALGLGLAQRVSERWRYESFCCDEVS